jgi:hypothetical protein
LGNATVDVDDMSTFNFYTPSQKKKRSIPGRPKVRLQISTSNLHPTIIERTWQAIKERTWQAESTPRVLQALMS